MNCLQKFQYRGFDIEESAAFYCAEVKVPAFTTGKKQLAGIGVPQKRTAAVRIRENGYLNYVINTKCIDKIVTVRGALTNVCDFVALFE